jgi:hypothetical protein
MPAARRPRAVRDAGATLRRDVRWPRFRVIEAGGNRPIVKPVDAEGSVVYEDTLTRQPDGSTR